MDILLDGLEHSSAVRPRQVVSISIDLLGVASAPTIDESEADAAHRAFVTSIRDWANETHLSEGLVGGEMVFPCLRPRLDPGHQVAVSTVGEATNVRNELKLGVAASYCSELETRARIGEREVPLTGDPCLVESDVGVRVQRATGAALLVRQSETPDGALPKARMWHKHCRVKSGKTRTYTISKYGRGQDGEANTDEGYMSLYRAFWESQIQV